MNAMKMENRRSAVLLQIEVPAVENTSTETSAEELERTEMMTQNACCKQYCATIQLEVMDAIHKGQLCRATGWIYVRQVFVTIRKRL